ncbi:hypothetical protein ACFL1B_04190 [Nanoarchaeota archaeon]
MPDPEKKIIAGGGQQRTRHYSLELWNFGPVEGLTGTKDSTRSIILDVYRTMQEEVLYEDGEEDLLHEGDPGMGSYFLVKVNTPMNFQEAVQWFRSLLSPNTEIDPLAWDGNIIESWDDSFLGPISRAAQGEDFVNYESVMRLGEEEPKYHDERFTLGTIPDDFVNTVSLTAQQITMKLFCGEDTPEHGMSLWYEQKVPSPGDTRRTLAYNATSIDRFWDPILQAASFEVTPEEKNLLEHHIETAMQLGQ